MHIRWETLETLEALVRAGSLEAAARELGIKHSSVSRRIAAMERELETALFLRGARLVATETCADICARAAQMRAIALEIEARLAVRRRAEERRFVVTTSDVLAPLLFQALGRAAPRERVEVTVSDLERELAPGVVDLALRPTYKPGGLLRGHRIGLLRMGVYRSKGGADAWVLPSVSMRAKTSMRWWRLIPPDAPGMVECDSLVAMRDACVAGLGRAMLPSFLTKGDARLLEVEEIELGTPVWLLSPATRQRDSNLRGIRASLARALRGIEEAWR